MQNRPAVKILRRADLFHKKASTFLRVFEGQSAGSIQAGIVCIGKDKRMEGYASVLHMLRVVWFAHMNWDRIGTKMVYIVRSPLLDVYMNGFHCTGFLSRSCLQRIKFPEMMGIFPTQREGNSKD